MHRRYDLYSWAQAHPLSQSDAAKAVDEATRPQPASVSYGERSLGIGSDEGIVTNVDFIPEMNEGRAEDPDSWLDHRALAQAAQVSRLHLPGAQASGFGHVRSPEFIARLDYCTPLNFGKLGSMKLSATGTS
jgi:hypothetical protein